MLGAHRSARVWAGEGAGSGRYGPVGVPVGVVVGVPVSVGLGEPVGPVVLVGSGGVVLVGPVGEGGPEVGSGEVPLDGEGCPDCGSLGEPDGDSLGDSDSLADGDFDGFFLCFFLRSIWPGTVSWGRFRSTLDVEPCLLGWNSASGSSRSTAAPASDTASRTTATAVTGASTVVSVRLP